MEETVAPVAPPEQAEQFLARLEMVATVEQAVPEAPDLREPQERW